MLSEQSNKKSTGFIPTSSKQSKDATNAKNSQNITGRKVKKEEARSAKSTSLLQTKRSKAIVFETGVKKEKDSHSKSKSKSKSKRMIKGKSKK